MADDKNFCPSCGSANLIEAKYCNQCGSNLPVKQKSNTKEIKSDFITMQCPNCGGKLQVGNDTHYLTCQFCGLDHIVRQTDGTLSLAPVVESFNKVAGKFDQVLSGSDRLAAEQTITRLKAEMPAFEFRVKNAQEKYDRELNKKPSKFLKLILYLLSIFSILYILIVIIGTIFSGTPPMEVIVLAIVAVVLLAFSRAGITAMKKKADNQARILSLKDDLEQALKEYQERKNQLEQLHRYTAER